MYRNILRKFNFVIYLLLALAFVIIQTTFFGYYPLNYLQPDFILILAIYLGFKRSTLEGGLLVLFCASLAESHSSAGHYFFLTTYLYAFLIAHLLALVLASPDFLSSIGIATGLLLFKKLALLFLLGLSGRASNGLMHFFLYLIPSTIVQVLLTPLMFHWFTKIDLITHKDIHSEDEYDINKGL